jgi:Tol biopolymer transport system component
MTEPCFRRIALVLLLALLAVVAPAAAPLYSDWSVPMNLGAPINSPFQEGMGTLSKDGSRLYFSSTRPCGDGDLVLDENLWVAAWSAEEARWQEPRCLSINADGFQDSVPALSPDEHWMYFVSDRPGSLGAAGSNGRDIWVSWRPDRHDDEGWTEPFNAGLMVNSALADARPWYVDNDDGAFPQLFFGSNRGGSFDIWVSDVFGAFVFGPPRLVPELNTTQFNETGVSVRHDGLELFFARGLSGTADIYMSTRDQTSGLWSDPVRVDAVNTTFNEQQPALSWDRETLLFASNRAGGLGGLDLYVSTRTKLHGR